MERDKLESASSGEGPSASGCEHHNGPSGTMK